MEPLWANLIRTSFAAGNSPRSYAAKASSSANSSFAASLSRALPRGDVLALRSLAAAPCLNRNRETVGWLQPKRLLGRPKGVVVTLEQNKGQAQIAVGDEYPSFRLVALRAAAKASSYRPKSMRAAALRCGR